MLELCLGLGRTTRELGELRRRDPVGYGFLKTALTARFRRLYGESER